MSGTSGFGEGASQLGGGLLGALALAEGTRHGGLFNTIIQRTQSLQDPAIRGAIEQSPFLSAIFGVGGGPRQTSFQASGQPGPEQPGAPTQFHANLPQLNPFTAAQLQTPDLQNQVLQARLQGIPFDTQLKMAKTNQLANYSRYLSLLDPESGGAMSGLGLTGVDIGSSGLPTLKYGQSTTNPTKVPEGTRGPGGQLLQTGDPLPGGSRSVSNVAIVEPGRGASNLQNAVARAAAALPDLKALIAKDPNLNGAAPIDLLPSGRPASDSTIDRARAYFNRAILPTLESTPGIRAFTPAGAIGIPGGEESIAAKSGGGDILATRLQTSIGAAANIAKALGDAGILSNQDIERVQRYLLPGKKGTKEENYNKAVLLIQRMETIQRVFERGGFTGSDDEQKAQIRAAFLGTDLSSINRDARVLDTKQRSNSQAQPMNPAVDEALKRLQAGKY